ncbi:lipase 1 [Thozetella sp. PMI_491]|nr:lipase 1 [Thozetella sp. PMI_491]
MAWLGAHIELHFWADAIPPPTEDPWYTPPTGYENEAPGTILRVRETLGNLSSRAVNCAGAYNILYRTTDSFYKPSWAVTTLFIPSTPVQALLSYQIPYDSAYANDAPSYTMNHGPLPPDIASSLTKGWFINVPDYEGLLVSFTAGVMSGHATLDSIRAALSESRKYGLNSSARYAMWGYSGGALASEWAAELQVGYAPELNFAGAALGGLTPNITNVLLTTNSGYGSYLIPPGFLGLTSQVPEARAALVSQLHTSGPYNATTFLSSLNMTSSENVITFGGRDISLYFDGGFGPVLDLLASTVINRDGLMGYHGVPQMPIYAYKAVADLISPIADTDTLLGGFCDLGVNILYERNHIGGHAADSQNGAPAAAAWLTAVLDGTYSSKYSPVGCTFRDISVGPNFSPN